MSCTTCFTIKAQGKYRSMLLKLTSDPMIIRTLCEAYYYATKEDSSLLNNPMQVARNDYHNSAQDILDTMKIERQLVDPDTVEFVDPKVYQMRKLMDSITPEQKVQLRKVLFPDA